MSEQCISLFAAIGTWIGALATLAAVIAAVYNARVAMKIATREKKHELRAYCTSGLLQVLPDGNVQNYIRTQSSSPTYKSVKESSNTVPVLEIRIDNIGELPVRIEGISIDMRDTAIPLNAINTHDKAELIFKTIDVGMTEVVWYEFEKIMQGDRKKFLQQAISNKVEITLSVRTNFWKVFSAKLPEDFIRYIMEE